MAMYVYGTPPTYGSWCNSDIFCDSARLRRFARWLTQCPRDLLFMTYV
jgi:hypothetical protein